MARIFLDGFNLALQQGTGVATYARNLSQAMGSLGHQVGVLYGSASGGGKDPLLREIGFFDELPEELWPIVAYLRRLVRLPLQPPVRQVPITGAVISASFRDRLPHFDEIWNASDMFRRAFVRFSTAKLFTTVALPQAPALMHWTYPLSIRLRGARNIYTMHDLVPLRLPYTTLDNKRRYLRLSRMLARQADHIVTVSEASRRDIIDLLGVPEERVTNTWQAVDIPRRLTALSPEQVAGEVHGSFGLTAGRYWLFFGAIEPKKNVGRMIQAYLASGVEDPLVIVGKRAWKSEEELRLMFDDHIRTLMLEGTVLRTKRKIILLDYAPFRLLVNLIRGARAVLFPSLYEGFGLPALEAMLLGTPVLTSNTASMPEVVGDAALMIDPYDIGAMAGAIRALDQDAELRARLAEAGPRQAAFFSPDRYAQRLDALYTRLGMPAAAPVDTRN